MIYYITTNGVGNAWVGNELRVVTGAGIPVKLYSLRAPLNTFFSSADVEQINRETHLLYPIAWLRLIRAALAAPFNFGPRFFSALANAFFSRRESVTVRIKCLWHLMLACAWAYEIKDEEVDLIHAQWIHSSGTVGMYGAWLLGVPFGFTGHATDLFRDRSALRDKIKRADYIICISHFHRDFFLIYGARPEQLKIAYCGIDTDRFLPKVQEHQKNDRFTILSSGRLVEKKGFEYLIDACVLLKERIDFQCIIAGSGELQSNLEQRIHRLDLADRVFVTGKPLLQEEIKQFMHSGNCYCLPCVWASDNDVDGLPQMLMEAMACGLPVISTRLVGIPDLVIDGKTGLLLDNANPEAIANALEKLYREHGLRRELALKGREYVVGKFNLKTCLVPLIQEFQKRLGN